MYAQGAISINEIAWMGSAPDLANDEWIELYNTGNNSVSVDGWTLTDGASLSIALSGTIASGDYAVLERTDDQSAPGVAFLIYTGALTNTGATLTLYRDDAALEDQVAGGSNWENIGGDNVTKHTPQYNGSGWVTALATPGEPVGTVVNPPEDDDDGDEEAEQDDSKKASVGVSIELTVPNVALSLAIEAPDVVSVNQLVSFTAVPKGIGTVGLQSLSYTWNFGDLSTSSTKQVKHAFSTPGEYVVAVYASFSRHEQIARKTIKVLPLSFTLSKQSNGDVLVHNNAKYEVDLSGYMIQGKERLMFPQNTIMLSNATIRVPKEKLKDMGSALSLYDQARTKVASLAPIVFTAQQNIHKTPLVSLSSPSVAVFKTAYASTAKENAFSFDTDAQGNTATSMRFGTNTIATTVLRSPSDPEDFLTSATKEVTAGSMLPYLGLCGLIGIGIIALFVSRKS